MIAKIIRCEKCNTALFKISCRAFSPGAHVILETEARCRYKKCASRKDKEAREEHDIEIEDTKIAMNPPTLIVMKKKRHKS